MKPTCSQIVPNPYFAEEFPAAPDGIPRGNLFELSVNPYNGQFVVTFQRSDAAVALIETALNYFEDQHGVFSNFARPVIESEPRYALRAVV